jgi:hypothetical protein
MAVWETPKHVAFLINVNNKEFGCVRLCIVYNIYVCLWNLISWRPRCVTVWVYMRYLGLSTLADVWFSIFQWIKARERVCFVCCTVAKNVCEWQRNTRYRLGVEEDQFLSGVQYSSVLTHVDGRMWLTVGWENLTVRPSLDDRVDAEMHVIVTSLEMISGCSICTSSTPLNLYH